MVWNRMSQATRHILTLSFFFSVDLSLFPAGGVCQLVVVMMADGGLDLI